MPSIEYTITRSDFERAGGSEGQPFQFSVEHSSLFRPLGVGPGQWPSSIMIEGLGNGQPLIARRKRVRDGDLLYVVYSQSLGCIDLTIFND